MLDFPLNLFEEGGVDHAVGPGRVGHFPQSIDPGNFLVVLLQNLLDFILLLLQLLLVLLNALLPLVFASLLELQVRALQHRVQLF